MARRPLPCTGLDSSETKRQVFENINATLGDANIFLYSPLVESGVDINVPVRKIYGTLCAKSNCKRACLQMLARCRNVADGEVVALNDPSFRCDVRYDFWQYQEVEALNREVLGLPAGQRRLRSDDGVLSFAEDAGVKRKTISVYNWTEKLNKHPGLFLKCLRTLAEENGYGWRVDVLEEAAKRKQ